MKILSKDFEFPVLECVTVATCLFIATVTVAAVIGSKKANFWTSDKVLIFSAINNSIREVLYGQTPR